jgi:chemotaxis protein CheD
MAMSNEVVVSVGSYKVSKNPSILTCIGLGSCLAIALYDRKRRIGGLTHSMLPQYKDGRDRSNPAKYVDTSIFLMVDDLVQLGSNKSALNAKIVGGSQMFQFQHQGILDIGKRNIKIAKETLKEEGIPIVASDVGGNKGRTITFKMKTGKINISINGKPIKCI